VLDERTATDRWNERWERFLVEECIERARREFSAETFRAFELVVLGELSPVEAAQEMGVPVKKVYNGKHRVLARMRALRAELEGEQGDAVP
jgi:DNA-directed RNA polymerase specialized sigma24 family protein